MAKEAPVIDACVACYWHAYEDGNPLPIGLRVQDMDAFCQVMNKVPVGMTDAIRAEWEATISQEVVNSWLSDRYTRGLVLDLTPTRLAASTVSALRSDYHFYDANRDMRYLKAAADGKSNFIISENCKDFFKSCTKRRGPSMNRYLERAEGIVITTVDQANPRLQTLAQSHTANVAP